eukprot:1062444-Pleurochrysis_carterae.AAC.2
MPESLKRCWSCCVRGRACACYEVNVRTPTSAAMLQASAGMLRAKNVLPCKGEAGERRRKRG